MKRKISGSVIMILAEALLTGGVQEQPQQKPPVNIASWITNQ